MSAEILHGWCLRDVVETTQNKRSPSWPPKALSCEAEDWQDCFSSRMATEELSSAEWKISIEC